MDAYMNKLDPLGCLTEGCWSLPDDAVMSAMHCVTRASDIRKAEREPDFDCPVRTVTDFRPRKSTTRTTTGASAWGV